MGKAKLIRKTKRRTIIIEEKRKKQRFDINKLKTKKIKRLRNKNVKIKR